MSRTTASVLAALVIGGIGCASPPAPERHWEKAGAGSAELEQDREACTAEAMDTGSDAGRRYEHQVRARDVVECMERRGWTVVEE